MSELLLSVVCPVYQNAPSLESLTERILATVAKSHPSIETEIILVDDGSSDESWSVICRLRECFPEHVTAVKLSRNFGQVSAILAGMSQATGDVIAVLSADLQDPPELLATMIHQYVAGNEIIVAMRAERRDDVITRWTSRFAYGIARKSNPRIPEGGFDFVLMSRRAAESVMAFGGRHRFFQGDVLWTGLPTAYVPYNRGERPHGTSSWSIRKRRKYFVDLVLDGSYLPIQYAARAGIAFAAAGLAYALIVILAWLTNGTPFPGWAPIMVTLLIIGGTILLTLSVIAEYVWRIYDDIRARPLFYIEEVSGRQR